MILAVNCYSVNLATNVQNIFTAAKLVAIAIIVGGGAYKLILGNTFYIIWLKPISTQELLSIITTTPPKGQEVGSISFTRSSRHFNYNFHIHTSQSHDNLIKLASNVIPTTNRSLRNGSLYLAQIKLNVSITRLFIILMGCKYLFKHWRLVVRYGAGNTRHLQEPNFASSTATLGNIATAFYTGLWAYDGWNNLNYVTEEIKNPSK